MSVQYSSYVLELADRFFVSFRYLIEAHSFWAKWGCTPKVHQLEVAYPSIAFPAVNPSSAVSHTMSSGPSSNGALVDGEGRPRSSESLFDSRSHHITIEEDARSHRSSWLESNQAALPSLHRRPSGPDRSDSRSFGSQGSYEDLEHYDTVSGRSVDRSESYSRSHLATELDLRTVITASSVISGELSVDG